VGHHHPCPLYKRGTVSELLGDVPVASIPGQGAPARPPPSGEHVWGWLGDAAPPAPPRNHASLSVCLSAALPTLSVSRAVTRQEGNADKVQKIELNGDVKQVRRPPCTLAGSCRARVVCSSAER
jgi:hypothetical protein